MILKKDDKILLAQRANTGYQDGNYGLPSGHVEANESFTAAMVRVAAEEIGITVSPKDLSVAHVMHRKSVEDGSERVDVFFVTENWQGEPRNLEPEKCSALDWFSVEALPENIVPVVKAALEHIQKQKTYSEFGWE